MPIDRKVETLIECDFCGAEYAKDEGEKKTKITCISLENYEMNDAQLANPVMTDYIKSRARSVICVDCLRVVTDTLQAIKNTHSLTSDEG